MMNGGSIDFDWEELDDSIVARFRRVLAHVPPGQLAAVAGQETLSYEELDKRSDQLASFIIDRLGVGDGRSNAKPVALVLPHQPISVVAIMGVVKAGHFFVPLDLVQGEVSLQQILRDCTPPLLLTTRASEGLVKRIIDVNAQTQVQFIDEMPRQPHQEHLQTLLHGVELSAQAYCCLQYTSGSTGVPRGVIRIHGMQLTSAYYIYQGAQTRPGDRIAHLLSYAHAITGIPIFGTLLNGATIHFHTLQEISPIALYEWLHQNHITQIHLSSSLIRTLSELADTHPPLTALRLVTTGGESMQVATAKRMLRLLTPDCVFFSRLGGTEAGNIASLSITRDTQWSSDQVPIGYPTPWAEVFILDERGRRLAPNEIGQIAVRSRYVAAGYWNQPELTAAKFLPDPEDEKCRTFLTGDMGYFTDDGMLEFSGREDFMVKIRGYRVELQAVELALMALPDVREAVVLALQLAPSESRLVAYVVLRDNVEITTSVLRAQLSANVPAYMVPAAFVFMAALPRTIAGKIDRHALPLPTDQRPALAVAYVAPRNETEAQLCAIWEELLGIIPIGVNDDFFALGGDSLLSMEMSIQVDLQLGQEIPALYFHNPTVAWLAQLLQGEVKAQASTPNVPT